MEPNLSKSINRFPKGMNSDSHPMDVEEGQYIKATNAVLHSGHNADLFALSNEEGFSIFSDYNQKKPDHLIIGMCPINDSVVVFSVKASRFNDLKTSASEIGVIEKDGFYRTVINDIDLAYWNTTNVPQTHPTFNQIQTYQFPEFLNFSIEHQIDATGRIDFTNSRIVYWTDGLNPPRYINLDVDYTVEKFNNMSQQVKLYDVFNYTLCNYKRTLEGGFLRPGVYQFFTRYLNKSLDATLPSFICNPIPVVGGPVGQVNSIDKYGANFDADRINKSIELTVTNIDRDFDFIQLCVVYYTGAASNIKINVAQTAAISDVTMNFVFDGRIEEELTIDEVVQVKPNYSTAQHIIQKDGRLLLSNLTESVDTSLQEIANQLRLKYFIKEVEYPSTNLLSDSEGTVLGAYSNEEYTYSQKGYRRGEAYSFGIQAVLEDGSETFVAHIPGWDSVETLAQPLGGNEGWLGTYVSDVKYTEAGVYFDPQNLSQDLFATGIRYHKMPEISQEPHFINGTDFIRILGVKITGMANALNTDPTLRDKIKVLNFVVQARDTSVKKSIYAMGFANELLLHDGQIKGGEDLRSGNGQYNSLIPVNVSSIYKDYKSTEVQKTYIINPFHGNTHIHDYNLMVFTGGTINYESVRTNVGDKTRLRSGLVNDNNNNLPLVPPFPQAGFSTNGYRHNIGQFCPPELWGWLGRSTDENARKNVFWYSPESIFLSDSWEVPNGTRIKPVMRMHGKPARVLDWSKELTTGSVYGSHYPGNRDLDIYDLHYGAHGDDFNFPQARMHRAPFFHIFTDYNRFDLFDTDFSVVNSRLITTYQKVSWNDQIKNDTDIQTKLKNLVFGTLTKLNNYDNEGGYLFTLDKEHFAQQLTTVGNLKVSDIPRIFVVLGMTMRQSGAGFDVINDNRIYDGDTLERLHNYGNVRISGQNQIYVEVNLGNNREGQPATFEKMLPIPVYNPDGFTPAQERNSSRYRSPRQWNANNGPDLSRYLYVLDTDNRTQYGTVEGKEYILVETFFNDREANNPNTEGLLPISTIDEREILKGDTYITKFAYRNSVRMHCYFVFQEESNLMETRPTIDVRLDADLSAGDPKNELFGGYTRIRTNNGAELRNVSYYFVESEVNTAFRHRPIERDALTKEVTAYGAPFFPYLDIEKSKLDTLDYESQYGQSSGYNIEYSFGNIPKKYFTKPFGLIPIKKHPTRTIYSQQSLEGEQSDKYRQFLANDYQDLPKNKGSITNMFEFNKTLYLHTDRSLFKTFFNQSQFTPIGDQEVFIGTGKIFGNPPVEIYPLKGGYAGTQHKWACTLSPFGYLFPDYNQGKVFLFTDSIEEISSVGMFSWFRDNMKIPSINSLNPNYFNNPANPLAAGLTGYYDSKHRRFVLGIKRSPFDIKELTYTENTDRFDTLSFSLLSKTWTSFHNYFPSISVALDNKNFASNNNPIENAYYSLEGGRYGFYFNSQVDPYKFDVTFVINDKVAYSKVFDVQNVVADFYLNNVKNHYEFFNSYQHYNDYQNSGEIATLVRDKRLIGVADEFAYNVQMYNNQYQLKLPLSATVDNFVNLGDPNNVNIQMENKARLRSRYLVSKYTYNNLNNYYLMLYYILTQCRISYR